MSTHFFITAPDVLAKGCGSCSAPEGVALIDACDEGPPVCLSCYRELVAEVAVDDERLVEVQHDLRIVPRAGRLPADCLPQWSETPVSQAELDITARMLGGGAAIWVSPQTGKVEIAPNRTPATR